MNIQSFSGTGKHNILIISGVHGDEIASVILSFDLALNKIIDSTKYESLTFIHAANEEAIKQNTREASNQLSKNLNRQFFEKPLSFDMVINTIKSHIEGNDVIIDIHNSPNCNNCCLLNIDNKLNFYHEFLSSLDIATYNHYSNSSTIKKFANDKGKIAFTYEFNGMSKTIFGESSESYISAMKDIVSIIDALQKIEFNYLESSNELIDHSLLTKEFKTTHEGIFSIEFPLPKIISHKTLIGNIMDLKTGMCTPIYFEPDFECKIVAFETNQFVNPQDTLFYYTKIHQESHKIEHKSCKN